MSAKPKLTFKIASEDWEFDAIQRLNHDTFTGEIPQHEAQPEGLLRDKFHEENTYLVCVSEGRLLGMVALRGQRPFSLDQKLPHLDRLLPPKRKLCEVRLLAVDKDFRRGRVTFGLMAKLAEHAIAAGYDMMLISGTTRQIALYQHLGFTPFGPLVGTGEAQFQPMHLSLETYDASALRLLEIERSAPPREKNFLPGPVGIAEKVREAFTCMPVSHRSPGFMADCAKTRRLLCDLVGAADVQIMMGSGTVGNDAVAAQLSLLGQPGVLVSGGEFGERLTDHASRMGLEFAHLKLEWGEALTESRLAEFLAGVPAARWLWTAHCETSTGILTNLPMLKRCCAQRGMKLCVDCISTIGVTPLDLDGVYLATASSGKGLAAFPGLALVFHDHPLSPAPRLPRYLDLGLYAQCQGVPFTLNSNLLKALQTSLETVEWKGKQEEVAAVSTWLRTRLRAAGLAVIGEDSGAGSPAVLTIVLPPHISSRNLGWHAKMAGFLLSYESGYLLSRNWIQICLMGEFQRGDLESLLELIESRTAAAPPEPLQAARHAAG